MYQWQLVGNILSECGLFWVRGGGWGIILNGWEWLGCIRHYFGWLGVGGNFFGWVRVGGGEWGRVHYLIMPICNIYSQEKEF